MLERPLLHIIVMWVALAGAWVSPQPSAAAQERIALAFEQTSCSSRLDELIRRMRGQHVVRAVDSSSVPGHILIDVERGKVSPEELQEMWNRWAGELTTCRVEIMKSCITANLPPASP
ncbi:MAG TPA: hypothetical protein VFQ34_01260 [Nitrospiraceae bacterium]|jgi:hypothetical protein|nr:hypothetical protein [Nitrospiraceae bacterium]